MRDTRIHRRRLRCGTAITGRDARATQVAKGEDHGAIGHRLEATTPTGCDEPQWLELSQTMLDKR